MTLKEFLIGVGEAIVFAAFLFVLVAGLYVLAPLFERHP